MKKTITILLSIILSFTLFAQEKSDIYIEEIRGIKYLVGELSFKDFQHEIINTWFEKEYDSYIPQKEIIEKLKQIKPNSGIVFMATWCKDTQREVPRFFKVIDQLGWKYENFTIYSLDRTKGIIGYNFDEYKIEYVPTFIFFDDNNNEIGRIIETPNLSLEEDILLIFSK